TFSFVIFTAAATRFLSDQVAIGANLMYGSDLVIETIGWAEVEDVIEDPFGGPPISLQNNPILELQNNDYSVNPNRILTTDFENDILNVEGIEKISSVIASPFHLTQIYSEEGKEFIAEIGDYAGLFTQEISLIGIDEEYPSTIKTKYIEFTQGDLSTSFNQIFNIEGHYKCIISEGLSENLDLNKDDLVRFNIQRGDESQIYTFQIAGVAASMPGFFSEFGRSSASAQMGGVMISDGVYLEIMDIPPIPYLDKIFIKLSSNRQRSNQQIIDEINSDGIGYDFDITDVEREVSQQQSLFSILDTFFTMTLDATIVICLFGLISSSYSTIIERKKDIGIIRTLGLKGKEINRLFTMESLIIMLSSGTVGVIVGWLTGLLLSTSINLLSDLPNIPSFPLTNMLSVYIISIIFVLIGMKLLLRNIRKKKIVEIYRETM
ncbi:MAG: ABC transporter permease, partial [Promethearchaeota archaeon]